MAVAPRRLFEATGKDEEIVNPTATENISIGAYGPASENVDTKGQQVAQQGLFYDFKVQIKKSCDEDDPEADL